jgi:Zn-dependent protease/CBS domain-containing protein
VLSLTGRSSHQARLANASRLTDFIPTYYAVHTRSVNTLFMTESLHLGRIRGIAVGVNWSLLPVFFLLTWSLADTLLPAAAPGFAGWAYWILAILTTAAFYASLLAHELAHAVVAQRHGIRIKGIVLWLFGGVAQMENDSPTPRAELEFTAAGPATSFALAAGALLLAGLASLAGASTILVAALRWLGEINILLGLFNLLPAFPLDGGRILRAVLWQRWGDRARATNAAGKVGRIGGYALIALGVLIFLFGGGALTGLWLALIGWFITAAAGQQSAWVSRDAQLEELRVSDAMSPHPIAVPSRATLGEVIDRYVRLTRLSSFPVVAPDGRVVGLVTLQRITKLPRETWATAPVLTAAAAPGEIVQCAPGDRLADVAARVEAGADRRAVVLEAGRLVGILTASDVRRARQRSQLFGQPGAPDAAGAAARSRPAGGVV